MRGRKPKPTHLKLIEGNPGKRPINDAEPVPPGALDEPPPNLTDAQRASWAYAIANAPAGLLRRLDRGLLRVWVVADCLHAEATEKLQTTGLLVKTPSGMPMQNPYLPIINRQAQVMTKAAAELGFTPSSRSRIATQPDETEGPENTLAGLRRRARIAD